MLSPIWTFLFFCVICATLCRIISVKVSAREAHGGGEEDTRMIQEIYRGLQRMEDRIEALETLLMDRAPYETARTKFE